MERRWLAALGLLAVGLVAGWSAANSQIPAGDKEGPEAAPAPHQAAGGDGPLDTLDWLVGDWASADGEVTAEVSGNFTRNDAFLVRSFRIAGKDDMHLSGMQVVAWDPARKTIRSWTFDSRGGFGEETWSQSGNRYTIRTKYTLPDGGTGSAVNVMTYVDDDKFLWKSVNREIDGVFQPDTDEVVLARKTHAGDAKGGE